MNKQSPLVPAEALQSPLHRSTPHDSGPKHVSGTAEYIDDLVEPVGTLHAYLGLSERAHAKILDLDLDDVRQAPGVVAVLTAADIPGVNDVSPSHQHDEPVFAPGIVQFYGQPMFAVIAETRDAARRATRLANLVYEDLPAALNVGEAIAAGGKLVTSPLKLERGDVATGMAKAERRLSGRIEIGGQDHFYLEGQISLAVPGEDDDVVLRRQGNPGQSVCRRRRSSGQEAQAGGENPTRPRRRHGCDRQAARFRRGLSGRLQH